MLVLSGKINNCTKFQLGLRLGVEEKLCTNILPDRKTKYVHICFIKSVYTTQMLMVWCTGDIKCSFNRWNNSNKIIWTLSLPCWQQTILESIATDSKQVPDSLCDENNLIDLNILQSIGSRYKQICLDDLYISLKYL